MLLYKVASFVVIDFENGVDYISFSVFDFSALKNGTEYSFVNDQFQVNDYTDVTLIKDKSGTAYTEATLDAFIATIKVISDPSGGGLPIGGTTGQILAKIDGTDYNAEWIDNLLDEVNPICKLGENISKGQAVYISGADGTNKIIKKASNATELTSSKTFGLLSASGVTNNKIRVITLGYLSGLDTSLANEGDPVWLGVNGDLIYGYANKPHAPEHLVFIGFVVRKNNVNGQIYVRVQNGFELNEIHDVKIESPANKNTLFYNSSNSLWENRLIGITDVTNLESALSGKVDGSGTTNFVPKFTASGTIGNSLIYDNGTNVGIGTTNAWFPASGRTVLSINGSGSSLLEFQKGGVLTSYIYSSDSLFEFSGGDSAPLTFLTSNSERMRITAGGYIGIGTSITNSKLHVHHNSGIRVSADSNIDYRGLSFGAQNNDSTEYSFIKWCPNNGEFKISANISGFGGFMSFYSNELEAMRITAEGNVGIGITSPFSKLHVFGRATIEGDFEILAGGSLSLTGALIDQAFTGGNPNQVLTSNSVGTIWSDLKTVNGNSLIGSGDVTVTALSTVKKVATITDLGTLIELTTTNSISGSVLIPANTIPSNCLIDLSWMTNRPVAGATTTTCRVYVNTSNSLIGATLLATGQITSASITGRHIRQLSVNGSNWKIATATAILTSDLSYSSAALTSFTLATNQDLYLIFAMQNANTTAKSQLSFASFISYE